MFEGQSPRQSAGQDDTASGTIPESVLKMIRRTSPETVVMNCPITEVTRESGNLKFRIFADPRNCCAHDSPNHAAAISQELCMAISRYSFASTRYRFRASPAVRILRRNRSQTSVLWEGLVPSGSSLNVGTAPKNRYASDPSLQPGHLRSNVAYTVVCVRPLRPFARRKRTY